MAALTRRARMSKHQGGVIYYAVAAREGGDLWLVLRVKYSPRSGFYVLVPHPEHKWDAHLSYHLCGRLHINRTAVSPYRRNSVNP